MPEVITMTSIALATLGVAAYRGEQAYRNREEAIIRKRTRVVYVCFAIWGAFFIVFPAVLLVSLGGTFAEQQGLATLAGIFGGVPAAIALLVGVFHAVMVWRVRSAVALVLVSGAALPFIFSDFFRAPWTSLIAAGYGFLLIGVSWRGIRRLQVSKGDNEQATTGHE